MKRLFCISALTLSLSAAVQIHLGAAFNENVSNAKAPFYIFKFKPLVAGVPFYFVRYFRPT
jgi:hypothetical protein